jgi:hypothetical protein
MRSLIILVIFFGAVSVSLGKYNLPKNLDSLGRMAMAKSLGFGSALKMNADPVPLGGYDGFQVSMSRDYIDMGILGGKGVGGSEDSYLVSNSLMFGKGFYYDFDAFFQMTTPQSEDFSSYGSIIRGRLYSFEGFPMVLGGLIHGSLSQASNLFGSNIFGYDLYLFSELSQFILFAGGGQARGTHRFIGGSAGLTGETQDLEVDLLVSHFWAGISYRYERWVVAGLTEVYFEPIYSVKIGYKL